MIEQPVIDLLTILVGHHRHHVAVAGLADQRDQAGQLGSMLTR